MPFRMKLPNADYFSDLIKAVSAVVDEGTFVVDSEKMKLTAMDPARISLVDFELGREGTEEYECTSPVEVTLSISEMLKFLKRAKKKEYIVISYDEESKRLGITLTDVAGGRERSFTISSLETTVSRTPTPKLTFEAKASVNSDALSTAIEDSSLVSDYVKVSISPDAVMLQAKGELGAVQSKLTKDGPQVYEISADREVYAHFSIDYLERIVKPASNLSDQTVIELATNKPIKLEFPIVSGRLLYYVAPRIETS